MARQESVRKVARWGWLPNEQTPQEFFFQTAIPVTLPNGTQRYVPLDTFVFTEEELAKLRESVNRLHAAKALPTDTGHPDLSGLLRPEKIVGKT